MINRRFWLAAALVLGIMAAGCKMDEEYELPPAKGKLIINNIPEEYNGKNVFFSGMTADSRILSGFINISNLGKGDNFERIKLAKISDGTAVMSLYSLYKKKYESEEVSYTQYIRAYSGDVINGNIFIVDDDKYLLWHEVEAVKNQPIITKSINTDFSNCTFSEGNFTVDWSPVPPEEGTGEGEGEDEEN